MTIEPDTKDWTWVLTRPCPECGYDAARVTRESLAPRIRSNAASWREVLGAAPERVRNRPDVGVWSALEYACHVRDVHRLFAQRLELMRQQERPVFDNWDQNETAIAQRYGEQDPAVVVGELPEAAEHVSAIYADVTGAGWQRCGERSDGAVFTVESLGRYHLHDVEHHLWDVRR